MLIIYYAQLLLIKRVKVKVSRNRPGVAQRVPGGLGSRISMTFGTWSWWGCQTHAPAAFTPRKCFWYSFSLGAESTPGPWYDRKDLCVKGYWKGQFWSLRYCLSKLCSLLRFPSRMKSHSKIAQFNWEYIGRPRNKEHLDVWRWRMPRFDVITSLASVYWWKIRVR
jgi:hypothetical protein